MSRDRPSHLTFGSTVVIEPETMEDSDAPVFETIWFRSLSVRTATPWPRASR